jgi:hypothetical protein
MTKREEKTGQYLIICKSCGNEVRVNKTNTEYCNRACKQQYYRDGIAFKKLVESKREAVGCHSAIKDWQEQHNEVGKKMARMMDFIKVWTKHIDTPNREALQDCVLSSLEHFRSLRQNEFRLYLLYMERLETMLLGQVDIDTMSSNLEFELLSSLPVSSIYVRPDPLEEDEEEEDDGDEFIELNS